MASGSRPPWAVHLRPGSSIPLEDEAARRYLRRGSLPEALLAGGPRPALIAGDLTLSHEELKAAAEEAAGRLTASGVTRGMAVAMFAENSADWIVAYLGLQLLGATVVGMNPAFKEAEAEQILSDSGASIALVDGARQRLLDALRSRLPALRGTAFTLEIAVGSSTQVAMFVAPILVFVSLALGHPMDFVFTAFEIAVVSVATLIVALIALEGRSNWLSGFQLVGAYILIAAAGFFID
jgi:uncharacterized protein YoaH (UPF0181 family)